MNRSGYSSVWRRIGVVIGLALVAASCGSASDDVSETTAPDQTAPDRTGGSLASELATGSVSGPSTSGSTPEPTTTSLSTTTSRPTTIKPTTTPPTTALPASCREGRDQTGTFDIQVGGQRYETRVFVPSTLEEGEPAPVVLNWHGLGSNGIEQVLLTDYESLAEQEGFIVVHPTGPAIPGSSGSIWELDQADIPDRDDLAYVDELMTTMVKDFCGDVNRIYSTGMSNGGFFTSRLVCEFADRLAAASSVAGVSYFEGCQPARPVPFFAFHGTADKIIPFSGGKSSLEGGGLSIDPEFFKQNMFEEFAEFAESAGCDPDPVKSIITEEVNRYDYLDCKNEIPMSFFEVVGGGHTWPGSPIGLLLTPFVGKTTTHISATELSWAMFSQNSLLDG